MLIRSVHSSCLHRDFNQSSYYVSSTILEADIKSISQEFSELYYVPVVLAVLLLSRVCLFVTQ